jgi:hypothetical protein
LDFGFLDLETPSDCGLEEDLELRIPDLLAACLDFTVLVREGAIVQVGELVERDGGWKLDFSSYLLSPIENNSELPR